MVEVRDARAAHDLIARRASAVAAIFYRLGESVPLPLVARELARLDVPRGASAERLAEALQAVDARGSVARCASPAEALERAAKEAGENDRIVVCGSFYTVAAALGAQQSELR